MQKFFAVFLSFFFALKAKLQILNHKTASSLLTCGSHYKHPWCS